MCYNFFDIFQFAGSKESKGSRVCVGVTEGAVDVNFTGGSCREREHDIAGAHADQHNFTSSNGAL